MNLSKPTPKHPWRNPIPVRGCAGPLRALRLALTQERGYSDLQGWHVTHALVREGEHYGELYRDRGVYYTLEQWTHGERGLTRRDLREGERFVRVYT